VRASVLKPKGALHLINMGDERSTIDDAKAFFL
jgi:hypothetical protein